MINTDFLPDAVQWSEGMLLSPQHFQQNDIHAQALMHQRIAGIAPHGWGVRHLRIDNARIAEGVISISECDAVMPDGLPVVFREAEGDPRLMLDVKPKFDADRRTIRVYLTVPPRVGARKVPKTSIRRYDSLPGRETLDEVTGIGDVLVERQRARLELFADREVPAGYPALPLLDIVSNIHSGIVLGAYHPPMFRIGASAFIGLQSLHQQFVDLRARLREKLRQLSGSDGDEASTQTALLGTEARMHLHAAREIAACIPLADAVLVDPLAPLSQAWWTLAQIVGRIASISSNPRPPSLDAYQHADCQPQFDQALTYIRRELDALNSDWEMLPFERVGDGRFSRRIPAEVSGPLLVELRATKGQMASDLQAWLAASDIASEDLLPTLRQYRVPGAHVRPLTPGEVAKLGLRPDALICELTSQQLGMGQGIVDSYRAGDGLVVRGDPAKAPAGIILLYRKKPRAASAGASNA